MAEKVETCHDKIRRDLICGFAIVLIVICAGFCISYIKIRKKIYHTYHMNREAMEIIHNVKIDLNKSTGHIIIQGDIK